jgi:hypothetical protein
MEISTAVINIVTAPKVGHQQLIRDGTYASFSHLCPTNVHIYNKYKNTRNTHVLQNGNYLFGNNGVLRRLYGNI